MLMGYINVAGGFKVKLVLLVNVCFLGNISVSRLS